ncbi:hypothetical protein [uncultured Deinococcus sp.]|uniref:hypothetical protein n=1 Tax=uncultured Deinococcus sp. TaxID=158789 RepID=UPI002587C740|nr:hypothetical protein [uncultured Deinococcus sp.]
MTVRSSLWLSTPLLLCAGLVGLLAALALTGVLEPSQATRFGPYALMFGWLWLLAERQLPTRWGFVLSLGWVLGVMGAAQALGGMLAPAVGGLGAASALAALLAFGRLSPRGPTA